MQPVGSISHVSFTPSVDAPKSAPIAFCPTTSTKRLSDFKHVFSSPDLRNKFTQFLQNVFMQLDEKKFYRLMDDILSKNLSYEETYQELFARIGEAKKGIFSQLRTLKVIKQVLVGQLEKLLCKGAKVRGYVELGYTGRLIRQMKSQADIQITGKKSVVNESERLTDYVEAGFPRPYDAFIPLNDYAPLPKNTVELITCPIGLHHCPDEKLDAFIDSIHDSLVPGGSFILRDHDVQKQHANDRDLDALVNVVHSVFNAATGELFATEIKEKRNFKSLEDWTRILERKGFTRQSAPLIQEGDPTDNALIRFTKNAEEKDSLNALETHMRMSIPGYERAQEQTYLTTLEWHLVATAKEYSDFITTNAPNKFPHFRHIKVLWKAFIDSCRDGIRASSISKTASSEYMLMNLFMLFSTTSELAFRGLTATSQKQTKVTNCLASISSEYAEFIKATPFYNFPYFQKIKELARSCMSRESSIKDMALTAFSIMEFAAKGILSAPISYMYQGVEPGEIHLIVEDPENHYEAIHSFGRFKAIKTGRYLPFTETLRSMAHKNVQIVSIAGQKNVQVKVKTAVNQSLCIAGCSTLSEIPILTSTTHKYVRLNVEVNKLSKALKTLEEMGAEIAYIHDF